MKSLIKLVCIVLVSILTTTQLNAQKNNLIGLNASFMSSSLSGNISYGVKFENKFTKHTGVSYGINSKSIINPDLNTITVYYSIPLAIKMYTKFVNLSLGSNIDYLYKNESILYNSNVGLDVSQLSSIDFGFIATVSKDIEIAKNFFIEPEFIVNAMNNKTELYWGFGICTKYKF